MKRQRGDCASVGVTVVTSVADALAVRNRNTRRKLKRHHNVSCSTSESDYSDSSGRDESGTSSNFPRRCITGAVIPGTIQRTSLCDAMMGLHPDVLASVCERVVRTFSIAYFCSGLQYGFHLHGYTQDPCLTHGEVLVYVADRSMASTATDTTLGKLVALSRVANTTKKKCVVAIVRQESDREDGNLLNVELTAVSWVPLATALRLV